ncbi:MAG: adenylate/guanylate cyclase domain-containing protein [Chthoniobacterales bacterium]
MKSVPALVACSDLTGFAKLTVKLSDGKIFDFLSEYYEFVGEIIASANGRVIKFMGDASLLLFPEGSVDSGVRVLLALQKKGDNFLAERNISCRHHIRAHFGMVCHGDLGAQSDKRPDVIGSTVNTLFLLKSSGFTMTPEVFRKLNPETRSFFKKHTPPVTYIPLEQSHKD